MQLQLDRITQPKTKEGSYGPYQSFSVQSKGVWYICIVSDWNRWWKPGQVVDVVIEEFTFADGKAGRKIKGMASTTVTDSLTPAVASVPHLNDNGYLGLMETLHRVEGKLDTLLQRLHSSVHGGAGAPQAPRETQAPVQRVDPRQMVQQVAQASSMESIPFPDDDDIPM